MTGRAQKHQHGLYIPVLMRRTTEAFFSSVPGQVNAIDTLVYAFVLHGPQGLHVITWHVEAPMIRILVVGMGSA